jgi:endo-1,4-beta-D-glucanase Y
MKNFGKQLSGPGILLLGLVMLTFIGCPTGSNNSSTQYCTVTFDTNGGNPPTIPPIQVEKGKTMGTGYPSPPTKTDSSKFAGWFDESDGKKYTSGTPINKNLTLKARWNPEAGFSIIINKTGNEDGDSVTVSPESGIAGDVITINYNLANTKMNNRLVFSGTSAAIGAVDSVGTGTRTYTINSGDAIGSVITINAAFTHTDKTPDTIAFAAPPVETKTYGDALFIKALATTGLGTGAITYTSSDPTVAAVNSSTGEVTILKAGAAAITITATKAADANYEQATAMYTLTVTQLQLTISKPTVTPTKPYDGTTAAAVTVGELTNKVGNDAVTVTAVANFNSANVKEANLITVVYTISSADAGNYIKPVDDTVAGTISRAAGGVVNTNPTAASKTATSITSSVVTVSGGQDVEYAKAIAGDLAAPPAAPSTGWQDGLLFSGLTANTSYYLFARAKANDNYDAGEAKISSKITTDKATITIKINITGDETGDSVTASPASGKEGTVITISYNLANTKANNRLVFSGTSAVINQVTAVGTGDRQYTINEADAAEDVININAAFTHTDLQLDTIAFADTSNEEKIYGEASFAKAITTNGSGTGAITYTSSDSTVATVNSATGAVTILKTGTTSITATKAADTTYAQATASYVLTVTPLPLTIGNPTLTASKQYDGNATAAVTAGALSNKVGSDTVTVTAVANYDSADVGTGKTITVVYTLGGTSAGNYIKPDDYTVTNGSITKAAGAAVSGPPTMASKTANSITINTVTITTNPGNQIVEYAIAATATATAPSTGWQTELTFNGLNSNTGYYVFARSNENANYNAGAAQRSAEIKTDLQTNTIEFAAPLNESKVYGSAFTKALSNTGSGSGAITYASSEPSIATVSNSGVVTILKTGTTTITATKAADTTYAQATASYVLTVTPLQLTIANPTLTASKPYDGNTSAAVTAGALTNKVGSDAVTVTAAASYNSADVGTGKTITVVYTLGGTSAGNYIKPGDYTVTNGSITKADGGTVSAPTVASKTSVSITVNAVTAPSGQTVEYAAATGTTAPSSGWTDSTTISGLTANTAYYLYARAKANDNYNAGTAVRTSSTTTTDAASAAVSTVINFESDALNKTYDYTEGDNAPSSVKVVTDPIRSNQKSLQISSNGPNDKGYNQAAVIPVKLPYTVKDYQTVSFKFSLVSGNTGTNLDSKQIQVYIAKDKATFKKWAFGNDSSASNHFEGNLIGAAPSSAVNFDSSYVGKWTDYSITITNPGNAIKDLTGDLYIAIGINCKTNAVYLFDDITFTPKSGFTPPPPPPSAPSTAPNPPSTGAVSSKNYRNMFTEFGYSSADVTAKVTNAWNKLFVNGSSSEKIYVESGSDMAYIYTADTDDVRSEGMSYGMMMCVQMNDKTRFNKLWKWARTYMYNTVNNGSNNRGYFSWQCSTNGNKKDQGPAPDGEVYFVTSLLFAHARWGSESGTSINNYAQEARQIIYDLTRRKPGNGDPYGEPSMFNTTNYLIRFATIGNSATHTDPSYHLSAFLECWALELESDYNANRLYGIWADKADLKTDVDFFKKAAEESRKYFVKATNSTTGLGPDYSEFDGTPCGGQHADFRFDAWRIAMNIGMDYAWWAADPWQKKFADRIQAFFVSKGVATYKNQWKLDGTVIEGDHSPGLVGCNAVASLAATNVNAWEFIEDFWNIPMTTGTYRYYDGCLYMMCMLHLSGNFKAYLSTNTTPANNSSITPTTASFDKKTSASTYKDIAVTVTLNGNTFSSITNNSTALTSGTDYSVSGTTYTIKKEYLAKQPVGTTTLTFNFSGGGSPELTVTITDTGSSSISPTTATFDKKTGAQADIKVTFTPNGNTVSNIKNGSTTLTSGTDYSVSGNDYTIKKEYLAKQAVGTTTLTFTFSGGSTTTQSIAITVKDTTGGAAGTKYDFANDNLPNGYPKYGGSGTISGEVTGGVLVVTKTGGYSTPKITLPFSITGNLSAYTGIKINVKGVSGDFQNKQLYAGIGSTNLGSVNNAGIPNGSFGDVTIPISGGTNTGDLDISFWLNNTQAYVLEIKSIELIP